MEHFLLLSQNKLEIYREHSLKFSFTILLHSQGCTLVPEAKQFLFNNEVFSNDAPHGPNRKFSAVSSDFNERNCVNRETDSKLDWGVTGTAEPRSCVLICSYQHRRFPL